MKTLSTMINDAELKKQLWIDVSNDAQAALDVITKILEAASK